MTLPGFLAVFLFSVSAALLAFFSLWRPTLENVQKRAETLVGGVAARSNEDRANLSPQSAGMALFKRLVTAGMPRKWGVNTGPLTLVLISLIACGGAWQIFHVLLGLPLWMTIPLVAFAAWFSPNVLARLEQGRADKRFVDLFPDAIDMIVRMLRAGLPVNAAIRTVAQEAPAPINGVFASVADQIDIGISFDDALGIGSDRIGLPDFRFFAAAIALQHTTGGNLVTTLEILGEIVRRRRAGRMKARAVTAEVRMSAYVLAAIPFVVFGALLLVSPAYLRPLFVDPRGNIILAVSFVLLLMAFITMRSMMRSVVNL